MCDYSGMNLQELQREQARLNAAIHAALIRPPRFGEPQEVDDRATSPLLEYVVSGMSRDASR